MNPEHPCGQAIATTTDRLRPAPATAPQAAQPLPGNAAMTSNATRQARYRQARKDPDGPPEEHLDITITVPARNALKRLARHHTLTQKATLEHILKQAQDHILDTSTDNGATYLADL